MERGESELLNICSVAAKEGDGHLQWAKHHAKYSRETKRTKSLGSGGWSRQSESTERITAGQVLMQSTWAWSGHRGSEPGMMSLEEKGQEGTHRAAGL